MRRLLVVAALGLLTGLNGVAQQLPKVIDQNVRSAGKSAGELGVGKQPAKLWIHTRTDAQRREVESRIAFFRAIRLDGVAVDVRPVQQVGTGPQRSELRVFNAADRTQARALLSEVGRAVPGVVLNDLSSQYKQARWIEPGHFELWLAPTLTRLTTR